MTKTPITDSNVFLAGSELAEVVPAKVSRKLEVALRDLMWRFEDDDTDPDIVQARYALKAIG